MLTGLECCCLALYFKSSGTNFKRLERRLMTKQQRFIILLMLGLSPFVQAAPDLAAAIKNSNNWAHARGGYNNQGYSALNQINTSNVKGMKLAWTFSTGVNRGHEGAPLVIDGVMYVHTAFPNNIYALDLNNDQKILWRYLPKQEPSTQAVMCCDNVNRGLAFGDGKIYLQQNNGVLVALNAKTGEVVWQTQVNDPRTGATNTNAPMVVKDKVLTGCAGGEFGVRCFIAAYYLKDGALAWKAYSTGSDADVLIGKDFNQANPQYSALSVYEDVNGGNKQGGSFKRLPADQLKIGETDLGIRTWLKPQQEKDGWQHGGGAVTGYFAFDVKTNLVYYGTGNPGVWNPDVRPGDNKWASSVFARDVDTGVAKWAMQTTPHDEWDYDATNEVILFDQKDRNGKTNTYATQVNKNGFIYTWQANNGTLIAAQKVHPFVNWATDVDLRTGVASKSAHANTHMDDNAKGICPSSLGAKGLNPAAYSPKAKLLYAPLYYLCMSYDSVESRYVAGQPWKGAIATNFSGVDGGNGGLVAFNPFSGKVSWYNKEKYLTTSGLLATAGGVIFYDAGDRWFKAIDSNNGKELWRFQAGSISVSNPISYQHKGKQYVATMHAMSRMLASCDGVADMTCRFVDRGIDAGWAFSESSNEFGGLLHVFSL